MGTYGIETRVSLTAENITHVNCTGYITLLSVFLHILQSNLSIKTIHVTGMSGLEQQAVPYCGWSLRQVRLSGDQRNP